MSQQTFSSTPEGLLNFINSTPTPYHLVHEAGAQLSQLSGFKELHEDQLWGRDKLVVPGGKYWFHRNRTTIVAFTVGEQYKTGGEFRVIGAHSDSPVLKVKPVSKKTAHGYLQVGVQCYGGGLWHTWFDRDLTLAGSVVREVDGKFKRELIHIKRPLLRVPSLCIHLQSAEERTSFAPNKENHLTPILSLLEEDLNSEGEDPRHSPSLLRIISDELKDCKPGDIKDLDLSLCDTQPGAIWGANQEFLSSPRLDNQVHCYTGLAALMDSSQDLGADKGINMVVCFDHEEVGSDSAQGAGSPIFQEAISRIVGCFSQGSGSSHDPEDMIVTLRKSFLISADVAHAIHPNYPDKHEKQHQPLLNKGTVIKSNENQRYATNLETGFILREIARKSGASVQEFVVRNDTPCGSTIGPILASGVGIRTVDVGVPSLSMHSIRETMGCKDVADNIALFKGFFANFSDIDKQKCIM